MITKIKYRKDGKTVKWVKYYDDDDGSIGGAYPPSFPAVTSGYARMGEIEAVPVKMTTTNGPFAWWTFDSGQA